MKDKQLNEVTKHFEKLKEYGGHLLNVLCFSFTPRKSLP